MNLNEFAMARKNPKTNQEIAYNQTLIPNERKEKVRRAMAARYHATGGKEGYVTAHPIDRGEAAYWKAKVSMDKKGRQSRIIKEIRKGSKMHEFYAPSIKLRSFRPGHLESDGRKRGGKGKKMMTPGNYKFGLSSVIPPEVARAKYISKKREDRGMSPEGFQKWKKKQSGPKIRPWPPERQGGKGRSLKRKGRWDYPHKMHEFDDKYRGLTEQQYRAKVAKEQAHRSEVRSLGESPTKGPGHRVQKDKMAGLGRAGGLDSEGNLVPLHRGFLPGARAKGRGTGRQEGRPSLSEVRSRMPKPKPGDDFKGNEFGDPMRNFSDEQFILFFANQHPELFNELAGEFHEFGLSSVAPVGNLKKVGGGGPIGGGTVSGRKRRLDRTNEIAEDEWIAKLEREGSLRRQNTPPYGGKASEFGDYEEFGARRSAGRIEGRHTESVKASSGKVGLRGTAGDTPSWSGSDYLGRRQKKGKFYLDSDRRAGHQQRRGAIQSKPSLLHRATKGLIGKSFDPEGENKPLAGGKTKGLMSSVPKHSEFSHLHEFKCKRKLALGREMLRFMEGSYA